MNATAKFAQAATEQTNTATPAQLLLGRLAMIIEHNAAGFLNEIHAAAGKSPDIYQDPDFLEAFPVIMQEIELRDSLQDALTFTYWIHKNLVQKQNDEQVLTGPENELKDIVYNYRKEKISGNKIIKKQISADDSSRTFELAKWTWLNFEGTDQEKETLKQKLIDLVDPVRQQCGLSTGIGTAQWVANWVSGISEKKGNEYPEEPEEDLNYSNNPIAKQYRTYVAELAAIEAEIKTAKPMSGADFRSLARIDAELRSGAPALAI